MSAGSCRRIHPFTVDRSDARSAVAFLEARTAKSFAERLIEAKVTEFFVLAADLMRRGILEDRYDFSRIACPVVWDNPVEPGSLAAVIGEAEDSRAPIFSVHRRTLANMDGNTRSILCEFWQRHGLFGSTQEAMRTWPCTTPGSRPAPADLASGP